MVLAEVTPVRFKRPHRIPPTRLRGLEVGVDGPLTVTGRTVLVDELLDELYAAGNTVGDEVLGRLLSSAPDSLLQSAARKLFEESPERAAALAGELVSLLATETVEYWDDRRDRRTSTARTVERTLRRVADSDPEAVEAAILDHYRTLEAFERAESNPDREAIVEAVEC